MRLRGRRNTMRGKHRLHVGKEPQEGLRSASREAPVERQQRNRISRCRSRERRNLLRPAGRSACLHPRREEASLRTGNGPGSEIASVPRLSGSVAEAWSCRLPQARMAGPTSRCGFTAIAKAPIRAPSRHAGAAATTPGSGARPRAPTSAQDPASRMLRRRAQHSCKSHGRKTGALHPSRAARLATPPSRVCDAAFVTRRASGAGGLVRTDRRGAGRIPGAPRRSANEVAPSREAPQSERPSAWSAAGSGDRDLHRLLRSA